MPVTSGSFQKGHQRPGPGRPKGSLAKSTIAAKEAIALAADALGGHERMVEWVKEDPANERAFWSSIYPRLLPLQVSGEGGGPVIHRVERVVMSPSEAPDPDSAGIPSAS